MLFKFELGFTESAYGNSMAIVYLGNFVVFAVMGKTHRWHHNIRLFILFQLVQAIGLIIIICSTNLAFLFIGVGLTGLCLGYCYSSHLYYGISGGRKRSALMSIHEIILSGGFVVGSLVSGYLSDAFDRYTPYKFALGMILVFGVVELFIWFALRPQQGKRSLSTSPT